MNKRHAPNRCDPRAIRIAQVKFVALPLDLDEPLPQADGTNRVAALFTSLRTYLIRVIGRLEAARP